jgi:hypothetical protein
MSENAGKYGSHRKIGKNGEKKVKLSGYGRKPTILVE